MEPLNFDVYGSTPPDDQHKLWVSLQKIVVTGSPLILEKNDVAGRVTKIKLGYGFEVDANYFSDWEAGTEVITRDDIILPDDGPSKDDDGPSKDKDLSRRPHD